MFKSPFRSVILGSAILLTPGFASAQKLSFAEFTPKTLTAPKGSFLLCPSRRVVDELLTKDATEVSATYTLAEMRKPGASESVVNSLGEDTIPNALIIPIPPGQTAKLGDVVMSWSPTGRNMQRGIVVGGSATEPVVLNLDNYLSRDGSVDESERTLQPDSFFVIGDEMQVGSHVVINDDWRKRIGTVVAMTESRVLVSHFMSRLVTFDKSAVELIPVHPKLAAGDEVWFAPHGDLTIGTVSKVDTKIGRVFVQRESGGEIDSYAVALGDVKKK